MRTGAFVTGFDPCAYEWNRVADGAALDDVGVAERSADSDADVRRAAADALSGLNEDAALDGVGVAERSEDSDADVCRAAADAPSGLDEEDSDPDGCRACDRLHSVARADTGCDWRL